MRLWIILLVGLLTFALTSCPTPEDNGDGDTPLIDDEGQRKPDFSADDETVVEDEGEVVEGEGEAVEGEAVEGEAVEGEAVEADGEAEEVEDGDETEDSDEAEGEEEPAAEPEEGEE